MIEFLNDQGLDWLGAHRAIVLPAVLATALAVVGVLPRWLSFARKSAAPLLPMLRNLSDDDLPVTEPDDALAHNDDDPLVDFARARGSEVFVFGYVSAEDVRYFLCRLRRIQANNPHAPLDIILHSVGADLSSAMQIARAVKGHSARSTVFVPFYANGFSSLIAIAANEVVLSGNAIVSFGDDNISSLGAAVARKPLRRVDDRSLLHLHVGLRETAETRDHVCELLHEGAHRRCRIGTALATGRFSGPNPLSAAGLRAIGISVSTMMPPLVVDIVNSHQTLPPRSLPRLDPDAPDASPWLPGVSSRNCHIGVRPLLLRLEAGRGSKAICMVHGSNMASRMVDRSSATEILDFIGSLPHEQPLDVILHTPGGNAQAGLQIARALKAHKGRKTVFVPYFAYSAGTLISLAADEIVMSPHAVLGPIDVQIACLDVDQMPFPALAYRSLVRKKPTKRIQMSVLCIAESLRANEKTWFQNGVDLMKGTYRPGDAKRIVHALNDGAWSHGYPIGVAKAKALGLKVSTAMPEEPMEIVEHFRDDALGFNSIIHCSGASAPPRV